jgi:hypothetical protein
MSVLTEALYSDIHLAALSRWFTQSDFEQVAANCIPDTISVETLGKSYEGRSIKSYTFGTGPIKILIWSQMHGNEPTGTHALLEWFKLLETPAFRATAQNWEKALSLCIVPMLNPDGAQHFTRQNAQGIDMNRDAVTQHSVEMQLFFKLVASFAPHWAFNLHDQRNIFSCGDSGKPATLSFLAPSANAERKPTAAVKLSKQLISSLVKDLEPLQIGGIARFTDEYYPRALGEYFHRNNIPCVLIECGPAYNDPHRLKARRMNVQTLVSACSCLCTGEVEQEATHYEGLPLNTQHNVDMLFRNCSIQGPEGAYTADVALLLKERINHAQNTLETVYVLHEIGDLQANYGLLDWSGKTLVPEAPLKLGEVVSMSVQGAAQKLRFADGYLVEHLL